MRPPLKYAPVLLLVFFCAQSLIAAWRNSVTIDENVHLPVGLYMWRTGDLSQDPANPPLSPMIAALPLLLTDARLETQPDFSHWDIGFAFMQQNADNYHELFMLSRALMILLGVLLGLLVYRWTLELYGRDAALVALFLYSFSPTVLAHAHLASLDFPGAVGSTLAAYAAWKLAARPSIRLALLFGAASGFAVLMKLSAAILVPVLGITIIFYAWRERKKPLASPERWTALLLLSAITAWLFILAGYGFQDVLAPISIGEFIPHGFFARLAQSYPGLRLPLPMALIDGIDSILYEGETELQAYYFAGKFSNGEGWWWYHLVAFFLKEPLALILAAVLAVSLWLMNKERPQRSAFVFLMIITVFAANALFNSRLLGVRHLLPAYPLLFIAVSPLFASPIRRWFEGNRAPRAFAAAAIASAGLAWYLIANLTVAPRYIQYFNEVAGGPMKGHRWLIDSNLDWGQDLIRLREYMDAHKLDHIHLAYFGTVHPAIYGIEFEPLERGARGPAAISVSFLMGRPYYWFRGDHLEWIEAGTYAWLQEHEPVDRVGAMLIYDLP